MGEMNPAIVPPAQRHRNQTMTAQGSACTEMRMGQRRHGRGGQNGSASNAPCVCGQDEYNEGNNRNFRLRNLSREYIGVFKGCTHVSCLPA